MCFSRKKFLLLHVISVILLIVDYFMLSCSQVAHPALSLLYWG